MHAILNSLFLSYNIETLESDGHNVKSVCQCVLCYYFFLHFDHINYDCSRELSIACLFDWFAWHFIYHWTNSDEITWIFITYQLNRVKWSELIETDNDDKFNINFIYWTLNDMLNTTKNWALSVFFHQNEHQQIPFHNSTLRDSYWNNEISFVAGKKTLILAESSGHLRNISKFDW